MEGLKSAFLAAIKAKTPDFEKAKAILGMGFDINTVESWGDSILEECLLDISSYSDECDSCDSDACRTCEHNRVARLMPIVEFFIENGWDTVAYGLNCVASLVHTTHDKQMFYAAKRILECPLSESEKEYEAALEATGTEESFQRCCEECHEQENLYYAMCELVYAKKIGNPIDGIHPYYNALGKKIDRIVYFADKIDFNNTPRGTEFNGDFGFVCGNEVLIVCSSINILFMNDRIHEEPQLDVSEIFGNGVVGATIIDVSFEHKAKNRAEGCYGQPTIILKLDNGKEIRFTHNFGELPDNAAQARFLSTETCEKIVDCRDNLFNMCARLEIDLDKIESYIIGANMSSDDITRTAIRLVDEYCYEVDTFVCENQRRPEADELVTSNWLRLFEVFIKWGLDSNSVYYDSEHFSRNLLEVLSYIDNTDIVYKLLRLLFKNGADPNVRIDDESFFEKIDDHVVINATLFEIEGEDRAIYEKEFRLWLLMMAYGGRLQDCRKIVDIKDGYDIDMFANCESFSYRQEIVKGDWFLHIYITKTGEEVAVL